MLLMHTSCRGADRDRKSFARTHLQNCPGMPEGIRMGECGGGFLHGGGFSTARPGACGPASGTDSETPLAPALGLRRGKETRQAHGKRSSLLVEAWLPVTLLETRLSVPRLKLPPPTPWPLLPPAPPLPPRARFWVMVLSLTVALDPT